MLTYVQPTSVRAMSADDAAHFIKVNAAEMDILALQSDPAMLARECA